VRARMDRRADPLGKQVLPVLVHGDAAFGGQGVNQETLCLAQTRGYTTGGTVHIIINNQIGFTTSDPRDMRSSAFCTDIVKMVESPVLHVNGDDPEAVVLATQLALEYRMEFRQDVVVEITCFRKLGHNEQDTPSLTQPLMYKKIAATPAPASCMPTSWPRRASVIHWATTWSKPTVPPWMRANTRWTRC
jgi:2-oxoglutarate dehydrogenase E1 component